MKAPFRYLCALFLVHIPLLAVAQDNDLNLHQMTTLPSNARFEIVHSSIAAKWTFRLNRYTGDIAQLVKTASGESMWEPMNIIDLPKVSDASGPRFILFTSGMAAKFTFLMDTQNGKTWELVSMNSDSKDLRVIWQPFE